MVVGIDLHPLLFSNLVYDIDNGDVGLDVGCLVGFIGAGIVYISFLGVSLQNLVVVQLFMQNF